MEIFGFSGWSLFIPLTVIVFFFTFIIQMFFPVEVYERAKSSNLDITTKGGFARTVESLYHIKRYGFEAKEEYWGHIFLFNGLVSVSVSALVAFFVFMIIIIFSVIFFILFIKFCLN